MVHGERIITLVAKYRIACCLGRHATAGGLILYGPDLSEVSNRLREFASQVCLLGCCGYNAQALDSPEPLPLAQTRQRWSRLSKQIFRVDKWSLCQG